MRFIGRGGTSLVETLVVMAVGGIIATLAIKLLHQSQVTAHQAETWLDLERGMMQWESQLRRDLRAADAVRIPDDQTLQITQGSEEIIYAVKDQLVERTLKKRQAAPWREGYALPGCHVTISQPEADMVQVKIDSQLVRSSMEVYVLEQKVGR